MAEKKTGSNKEIDKKIIDLKIELLKNATKKKSIKKEIARLLTMARNSLPSKLGTDMPSSSGKNQIKSDGGSK